MFWGRTYDATVAGEGVDAHSAVFRLLIQSLGITNVARINICLKQTRPLSNLRSLRPPVVQLVIPKSPPVDGRLGVRLPATKKKMLFVVVVFSPVADSAIARVKQGPR